MLNGKSYRITEFNIFAEVWANSEFATEKRKDGILNLSDMIKDHDYVGICKMVNFLLEDKKAFTDHKELLKKAMSPRSQGKKADNIISIFNALVESIGVSQISIENAKKEIEIKKRLAADLKELDALQTSTTASPQDMDTLSTNSTN